MSARHPTILVGYVAALVIALSPGGVIAQRGDGGAGANKVHDNGLPAYGLLQVQPAPEYTYGPNIFDVVEDSIGLLITGEGWWTHRTDGASFLYRYSPEGGSKTLFTDPDVGPWVNQPEDGTLRALGAAGYLYATVQSILIEPEPNPVGRFSAVLYHVDTSGHAVILDSIKREGWGGIGTHYLNRVHVFNPEGGKLIAYMAYNRPSTTNRPGRAAYWEYQVREGSVVRTREYGWEVNLTNEFPLGAYVRQDTLFRIVGSFDDGIYYLARHDLTTGSPLPYPLGERLPTAGILGSHGPGSVSYGSHAWYRHGIAVEPKGPYSLQAVAKLMSVGYDGRERFRVSSPPPEGYVTGPNFANSTLDTTNNVAILVSDIHVAGTSGRRTVDDYALLVEAFDAVTAESKWRTQLSLDGVGGPEKRYLRTVGVVARPTGGYIIVADAGSAEAQPDSLLHNTYMPLFFLDSVGCFAPGCRLVNAIDDLDEVSFALTLSPNPVVAGTPVRLDFAHAATNTAEAGQRYQLTDAAGRLVDQGPVEPGGAVPTHGLGPGTYYLTVPISNSGRNAVAQFATRVLIVR